MDIPVEFKSMLLADIDRIKNKKNLTFFEKLSLHTEIDGRYQACIQNWFSGLYGCASDGTRVNYSRINDSSREFYVDSNLNMMCAKLETYVYGINSIQSPEAPSTNVTVNTSVSLSLTFEQAREKVENMTSLTDEQTQEVLEKIADIETAINGIGSPKSKWEKIKPVLGWLMDKSFDIGMTVLPLVMKLQG